MKTIKTIILTLSLCVINQFANAQIVYTNVQPDVKLICKKSGCSHFYPLDLNNDGTADFNITVSNIDGLINAGTCNACYNYRVEVTSLNGNSVASESNLPAAFISGTEIGSLLTWGTSAPLKIREYYCCYYGGCSFNYTGNWNTTNDRYLGLKLISNAQTYYGWARLSVDVSSSQASFKIKDYAFDSTPDHSILTGATSGARFAEENYSDENNFSLQSSPNPFSNSTTISFSLSQSQKASLKIFDVSGRLVSMLADKAFEAGENKIVWNADDMNTGIYFLQFQSTEGLQTEKLIITK